MSNENIDFVILAGKNEEDGENIKFSHGGFLTMEEVIDCIKKYDLKSYHFCRVEKYVNDVMVKSEIL